MNTNTKVVESAPVGWSVESWSRAVGICRAHTYKLLSAGQIRSVSLGKRRLIIDQPTDWLARLADEQAAGR